MPVIKRYVEYILQRAAELDRLELKGPVEHYAATYLLQSQALIDIAERAASLLGYTVEGYIDAGKKLLQAGVIDEEEYRHYVAVVRFRDVVVHQYAAVDLKAVEKIVEEKLYKKTAELALKIAERIERAVGEDP
ncbi:MAG: DUF86 domain-containing protein [Thermoproteus sp. AZ2]|jgi:uncharacterized protein YutE (UPF0331/DUF86 family)|uniref:DUF86 domain-containing protein n=1 Tax=Thermoproteus sp. AZ2 TaxID=1609232 RepID=A0ACC6UY55_9CREN